MSYPQTLQEKLIASMNEQAVYWMDPQQTISAATKALMLRYVDHGGDLNLFITDLFNREQFSDASTYNDVNARLTALKPVLENILTLKGVVPAE